MPTLTQGDVRCMLQFLQELHTLCDLEAFPQRVLSALPKVVASEFTGCSPTNFHQARLCLSSLPPEAGALQRQNAEQVAHQNFFEHPFVNHYLQTNDGSAHAVSDFLSETELHRLEGLYQSILRPVGMEEQINMVLPVSATEATVLPESEDMVITLHRSQRNFSERDRLILNLLRPHLLQAYSNAKALTQIQQQLTHLSQTIEQLNVIALALDGQVQLMTERAWMLLKKYFQVSSQPTASLPDHLQRWVNYQIGLMAQNHFSAQLLPLRIEHEARQLTVQLIRDPLQNQYLLVLEEIPPSTLSSESLELLGLTRRESEVLFWVVKDKSMKQIASDLGIGERTVKKHLERIYEKLGVQTRTAAVIYVLKHLGMLKDY